jgi:phosphoenolpyruvate carboxylase
MLPAWLGTDAALKSMSADLFAEMADWPFFHMQMDTLEMVLAKTDVVLSEFYANRLTPQKYRPLEQNLRSSIEGLINVFLALKGSSQLLADEPETRDTLMVRNTYLDPLHLLQAELLERLREGGQDEVAQALKVTMAGIASGLRDTG